MKVLNGLRDDFVLSYLVFTACRLISGREGSDWHFTWHCLSELISRRSHRHIFLLMAASHHHLLDLKWKIDIHRDHSILRSQYKYTNKSVLLSLSNPANKLGYPKMTALSEESI